MLWSQAAIPIASIGKRSSCTKIDGENSRGMNNLEYKLRRPLPSSHGRAAGFFPGATALIAIAKTRPSAFATFSCAGRAYAAELIDAATVTSC